MGLTSTLIICVLGLYGSFITWSVLQEKINTKPYGDNEYFKAPLFVNSIQCLFAIVVSFIYSKMSSNNNPFLIFTRNDKHASLFYFKKFLLISLSSSISSPIGYQSLAHVDFLIYLLCKSCKLIPLMVVHFVFYRTRFPAYKYVVALMVTCGVLVFTLAKTSSKKSNNDGQTILGMAQLFLSMILDGLTNSTQDQLFKTQKDIKAKFKVNGTVLMCVLNSFMLVNTLLYALIFNYEKEINDPIKFIKRYPQVLQDILIFGIFGSCGQIFVFIILEKFDSIILVTATVTRKMLSMVLSVLLFGHSLNSQQILGVALVFIGIGYEALIKIIPQRNPSIEKKIQ